MKITTLVDNTTYDEDLLDEHGLSVHISVNGRDILFDTGMTNKFSMNAAKLDVNLRAVDIAIISHAHYDHLGGLIDFLSLNDKAKIYLKEEIFDNQYVSIKGGNMLERGYSDKLLEYQDRFTFLEEEVTRDNDLIIIKNIDKQYPLPKGNKLLYTTDNNEEVKRDTFNHELLFAIEHDDELMMFSGCAHNGILNMISTFKKHFPNKNIKIIHGGFHLINSEFTNTETDEEIMDIANQIKHLAPNATLYTGHCTSSNAINQMKAVLGNNLKPFYVGHTITLSAKNS